MATDSPDARNFSSWEDAFEHPIPVVRSMEKKLRSNLDENHNKLRTLVGASYRDLLGTARTIIDVNDSMQEVEHLLRRAGSKTNSRLVDASRRNLVGFDENAGRENRSRFKLAAQIGTLRAALNTTREYSRRRDACLVSAKLLILSRLLHKVLSSSSSFPFVYHDCSKEIGTLRERVLRRIDLNLADTVEPSGLVDDLTAFCLLTSSSAADALEHFFALRERALKSYASHRKPSDSNDRPIIQWIQLFLETFKQSKHAFPDLLATSLRQVRSRPLLEDPSIKQMYALRLDMHTPWFEADIQRYTPWTRQDDLTKETVDRKCRAWSQSIILSFDAAITSILVHETDVIAVASARKEVLQHWLTSRHVARGLRHRQVLELIREPFRKKLLALIEQLFAHFRQSVEDAVLQRESLEKGAKHSAAGLWSRDLAQMDLSNGAETFKTSVLDQRYGRHPEIKDLIQTLQTVSRKVTDVQTTIQSMQNTRWDDDYSDDDEGDDDSQNDEEDEHNEPDSTYKLLSREDPRLLQSGLQETAAAAVEELQRALHTATSTQTENDEADISRHIFYLRALREVRARLPLLFRDRSSGVDGPKSPARITVSGSSISMTSNASSFCNDTIHDLHNTLCRKVTSKTSQFIEASIDSFVANRLHIRALWDNGHPPLPVQTAPGIFSCLRKLVREMESLGFDLWTPHAVAILKGLIKVKLASKVRDAVEKLESQRSAEAAGDTAAESPPLDGATAKEHDGAASGAGDDKNQDEKDESAAQDTPDRPNNAADPNNDDPATQNPSTAISPPATPTPTPAADPKNKQIQLHFDTLYLSQALASPATSASADINESNAEDPLAPLISLLTEKTGLDDAAMARLHKGARDFWRRTYLLFGLLAVPE